MRDDLTQTLYNDFPALYTGMCWGFETGNGWYQIIRCLSISINNIIASASLDPSQFTAVQVKEKFGLLRVYISTTNNAIQDAIYHAVQESSRTCEMCGGPGVQIARGGWMRVSCEPCEAERVRIRRKDTRRYNRRDSGTMEVE
ncbi:uncharacterized protein BDZ99DRAFT_566219 [Mytilinidion resinicola]|uniref:Uncharacterized protein n=1 Tax=Mytilinidion resinicola TaxID=574789 RepID=A0A6A6Z5K0_9PEZI|nr:uncharacterized protein BDZ99DRAFT_566219 [Mytilinidion resinicola]KAF2816381.1 hypothetical protein BDZ99DRAFT_566219 [Mytilinidion resinicola]